MQTYISSKRDYLIGKLNFYDTWRSEIGLFITRNINILGELGQVETKRFLNKGLVRYKIKSSAENV